jgi:acyl-coenzyme A synthetase/AMP-(fatty) acid ligase
MNFARDVVDAAPADARAIVEISRGGRRREFSFGGISDATARLAGTFSGHGVGRGDVVLTLIGNRPQWVLAMVACFRIAMSATPPSSRRRVSSARCCSSPTARNVFIAPWLRGAAALLHDARFDPRERMEICARERVAVLCMAPTEYRVIAKRTAPQPIPSLRSLVAAGEALNPEVLEAFRDALGLEIRDGYGQTETGQLTGGPAGAEVRPGSMGRPLPGIDLVVEDGELVLRDPRTDPTFFVAYLDGAPAPADAPWRTGDRVRCDEDGYLYFESRTDDVIISAGYRIGPFEVESALVSHAAVAEAAVVAAPDEERGSIVRAIVVLRRGFEPGEPLARELQEHVKQRTAPYKYPRLVEFAGELPKTASGKVQRALLRGGRSA